MPLSPLVKYMKSIWQMVQHQRDRRYLLKIMRNMDGYMLCDIGLSREDIKKRERKSWFNQ